MKIKTDVLLEKAEKNKNESSISKAEKTFAGERDAARVFAALKTQILNINQWNAHSFMSSYEVFDKNGEIVKSGELSVENFIRISITGSGKYDWIRIIDIHDSSGEFIITVKPAFDPTSENVDETIISHFFTDAATNNFCIFQKGKTTAFCVIGLDERQNISETKNTLEKIRNIAVNFATYIGTQKGEWEKFCHHFLEDAAEKGSKID